LKWNSFREQTNIVFSPPKKAKKWFLNLAINAQKGQIFNAQEETFPCGTLGLDL
jgi:hypothetical protein